MSGLTTLLSNEVIAVAADAEFRELVEAERALIEALLSFDFPGSKELMAQLPGLLARRVDDDGSLVFRVRGSPSAKVRGGPVVEGSYPEDALATETPVRVNVILHVKDGNLRMLEVYKDDSSPLTSPLDPRRLVLFSPLVGERKTI